MITTRIDVAAKDTPQHQHTNTYTYTHAHLDLGIVCGICPILNPWANLGAGVDMQICSYAHGGLDAGLSVDIVPHPNAGEHINLATHGSIGADRRVSAGGAGYGVSKLSTMARG